MKWVAFKDLGTPYRATLEGLLAGDPELTIDCKGMERLPTTFLVDARSLAGPAVIIRLSGLPERTRLALTVLQGPGLPVDADGEVPPVFPVEPPFTTVLDDAGVLTMKATRDICHHGQLGTPATYEWISGLTTTGIIIDMTSVDRVNSVLVSWMLQISQLSLPVRPRVINACRVACIQMERLRLDHLVDIDS
jgi:hypothetical protein